MLAQLLDALNAISEGHPLVFPAHPRTKPALTAQRVSHEITVVEPHGNLNFLDLMAGSSLVVTDSGGIQEPTVLGVPFLTQRDNTEHPITITEGTNQVVEWQPDSIIAGARARLGGGILPRRPSLWAGRAGERIAAAVLSAMDDPRPPTDR